MKNKYEAFELLSKAKIPIFPVHGILPNGDCTCELKQECPQKGNHPYFDDWSELMTTNCNLSDHWRPNLNYGIPTGSFSKLIIVEIDRTKNGSFSMGRHQHQLGFISTLRVNTDRDHFDLYYKYEDFYKLKINLDQWDGIKVKGENDWVLGPYSQVFLNKFKIPDLGEDSGCLMFKDFSKLYSVSDEIYSLTKWREVCI